MGMLGAGTPPEAKQIEANSSTAETETVVDEAKESSHSN
jgi:hypothetical protein